MLFHPCPPGAEGKHICPRCSSEDTKVRIAAALSALLRRAAPPKTHNQPAAGVRRSAALSVHRNTQQSLTLPFMHPCLSSATTTTTTSSSRASTAGCGCHVLRVPPAATFRYGWFMQGAAWRLQAGGCSPAAVQDRAAIHPCFYLSHPDCRRASGIGRQEARCAMCPPAPAAARARRQQRLLRPRKRAARSRRPRQRQQAAAAQPPPCPLLWAAGQLAWCHRWAA